MSWRKRLLEEDSGHGWAAGKAGNISERVTREFPGLQKNGTRLLNGSLSDTRCIPSAAPQTGNVQTRHALAPALTRGLWGTPTVSGRSHSGSRGRQPATSALDEGSFTSSLPAPSTGHSGPGGGAGYTGRLSVQLGHRSEGRRPGCLHRTCPLPSILEFVRQLPTASADSTSSVTQAQANQI